VITAAHCLQDKSILNQGLTVVAGLHSQSRPNPNRAQRKAVLAIQNHPEYNDMTNENDIAIMRLASPVTLNSYVNHICLPTSDPDVQEDVIIGKSSFSKQNKTIFFSQLAGEPTRSKVIHRIHFNKHVFKS